MACEVYNGNTTCLPTKTELNSWLLFIGIDDIISLSANVKF
jgi:hypothetical protein